MDLVFDESVIKRPLYVVADQNEYSFEATL